MKRRTDLRVNELVIRWVHDDLYDGNSYGCYAEAQISYAIGIRGDRRIEHLRSGGLYGIENPSKEWRAEVEGEQLADLRLHVEMVTGLKYTYDQWKAITRVRRDRVLA